MTVTAEPAIASPSGNRRRPAARRRAAPGLQVRGDGDIVDHHDRHQYYGGHAPGIAFQGERLEVFPGELLAGGRRTMSSRGAARWPA
jgi:hypothetical protein